MDIYIDETVAQLSLIRLMTCYSLSVDEAVDQLLVDYIDKDQIGIIIQAGEFLKKML